MAKKLRAPWRYTIEFNRARGDNTRLVASRLERKGYEVERVPHLSTITLRRPPGNAFETFRNDIRAELQPRQGAALVCSTSGKQWLCRMKGNRSGKFVSL